MDMVKVPFGDDPRETALLLLGAAEASEYGQEIVRTDGDGNFLAPREVVEDSDVDYEDDDDESEPSEEKAPAKKAAAKKTAKKSG